MLWLLLAAIGFGVLAGGYHLYLERHPHRLLVIVDASEPMRDVWSRLAPRLRSLSARRYTEFALATQRDMVHHWSTHLNLGGLQPGGARDFGRLAASRNHLLLDEDPEVVLISNAPDQALASLPAWRRIRP